MKKVALLMTLISFLFAGNLYAGEAKPAPKPAPKPEAAAGDSHFRVHLDYGVFNTDLSLGDQDSIYSAGLTGNAATGFGYLLDDRFHVGGRLIMGYRNDGSDLLLGVAPYFEFLFMPGQKIRPFAGGTMGMSGLTGAKVFNFDLAGLGGAHFMFFPHVSFDLTGLFGYRLCHVSAGKGTNFNYLSLSVLGGLSVWF